MANPVIGPTVVTYDNNIDGPLSVYDTRTRYRQKKPYDQVLAYDRLKVVITKAKLYLGSYGGLAKASAYKMPWQLACQPGMEQWACTAETTFAKNQAYSRFKARLGETASIGVTFAERKQALEMISSRAVQLYRFTRFLRQGMNARYLKQTWYWYREAAKTLSVHRDPRTDVLLNKYKHSRAKNWSNLWLEFHFGWSPLINDIGQAISVLDSNPPPLHVNGKSGKYGWKASTYYAWDASQYRRGDMEGFVQAKVGADIVVTNPNLYLSSKLGLTDPLGIAWELVPFSFVVDWFVNVSDYLAQFSDFLGLKITNPYTTVYTECKRASGRMWVNTQRCDVESKYLRMTRTKGLPAVTLTIRPPWRLSASRALTSIALLVQKGFSKDKTRIS